MTIFSLLLGPRGISGNIFLPFTSFDPFAMVYRGAVIALIVYSLVVLAASVEFKF